MINPEIPDAEPSHATGPDAELTASTAPAYGLRQWVGWVLGPAALMATLLLPAPEGLSMAGWHTAGVAC
ncbi:MAG: hypothetical protein SGI92_24870 [Bryobacteraceae bacterium]|nr:hypothetical protein [Bryobacteraceae bacterium]